MPTNLSFNDQLVIDRSSGNVGIGLTNPSQLLHVATTSTGTTTLLHLQSVNGFAAGGGTFVRVGNTGADSVLLGFDYNTSAFQTRNGSSGAVVLAALNTGYVGVGITAPASALHVRNNAAPGITIDSTLGSGRQYQLNAIRTGLSNAGFEIRDVTAGIAVMSFDASQNVGINNASPGYKFDVAGNLRVTTGTSPNLASLYVGFSGSNNYYDANTHFIRNGGANEIARFDTSANFSLGSSPTTGNRIILGGIGTGTSYVKANEAVVQMGNIFAGTLQLLTNNSPQLTVTSVGDVGIGTATPSFKLDVAGSFRATGDATYANLVWHSEGYSVAPGPTYVPINLTAGNALLVAGYVYRITLTVPGTGTDIGTVYLVRQTAATTWALWRESAAGETSNHPLLRINPAGTGLEVYHNHASGTYGIWARVDSFNAQNITRNASTVFGLAGGVASNYSNVFALGTDAAVTTNVRLYVAGKVLITSSFRRPDDAGDALTIGNGTETHFQDTYLFNNAGGGTEFARLNSTGLGLGHTAPNTRLHVLASLSLSAIFASSNAAQSYIRFDYNASSSVATVLGYIGTGNGLVVGGASTDLAVRSDSGGILLATSSNERVRVTNAGDVGVNTGSPGAKLHVNGTMLGASGIRVEGSSGWAGRPSGVEVEWNGTDGYVTAYDRGASTWRPMIVRGSTVTLQTSGVTALSIDATQKVAIGAVTPQTRAEINYGTLIAVAPSTPNTTTAVTLSANDPGTTAAGNGVLMQLRPITNRGAVVAIGALNETGNKDGSGALAFYYNNGNGTVAEAMRLSSAGNLGIGTTSPTVGFKLDVRGSARIEVADPRLDLVGTYRTFLEQVVDAGSAAASYWRLYDNTAGTTAPRLKVDATGNFSVTKSDGVDVFRISQTGSVRAGVSTAGMLLDFRTNNPQRLDILWQEGPFYFNPDRGSTSVSNVQFFENSGPCEVGISTTNATAVNTLYNSSYIALRAKYWNGTAAVGVAPTLQTVMDSTAPLYRLVLTAGSGNVSIRSDGNVGIGTASPAAKLDFGTNNPGFFLRANPGAATSVVYTGYAHNDLLVGTYIDGGSYANHVISFGHTADAARKFHIGSANSSTFNASTAFVATMTFTAGNNVGIGTTGPASRLHVYSPTTGTVVRVQNGVTSGFADTVLSFNAANTATSTDDAYLDLVSNNGAASDFIVATRAAVALSFRTSQQERMRILATGNVGIGNTSPSSPAANYTLAVGASGSNSVQNAIRIYGGVDADKAPVLSLFRSGNTESLVSAYRSGTVNGLALGVGGGIANYNDATISAYCQMFLTSTGRLGLNVAEPDTMIEARGTDAGIVAHYYNNSRGGIYALSTQRLAFAASGSGDSLVFGHTGTSAGFVERMRIVTSTGNVGIGTTSTLGNSRLDVVLGITARNSSGTAPVIQTYNANAGVDLKTWRWIGNADGTLAIQTVNDAYTVANSRLLFSADGRLAVGTAALVTGRAIATVADIDIYEVRVGRGAAADDQSTVVGRLALAANTTGGKNTAIGYNTLNLASTANYTVAVGAQALQLQTGGDGNIAIGYLAGGVLSTGQNNVIIGTNAGAATLATGSNNIIIGASADTLTAASSNKLVIGSNGNYVATNGGPTTYYATAGDLNGYIIVILNGAEVKIPVYKV